MTIDNVNKSKLVPKKDYKNNRLISGKLQLCESKLEIPANKIYSIISLKMNQCHNLCDFDNILWRHRVDLLLH